MDKNYLKMGPHDVGGEESLPIDTTDNNMTHWEKYANALRIVVSSKRIITLAVSYTHLTLPTKLTV